MLLRLAVVGWRGRRARAALRAAEAAAVEANRHYQRLASLACDRYMSGARFDQARDAARAGIGRRAERGLHEVAGIVAARRVKSGETVGHGQPLLTI